MGYTIQHNSIFWPTANCGVISFVLDQLGREKFRNTWEKKKKKPQKFCLLYLLCDLAFGSENSRSENILLEPSKQPKQPITDKKTLECDGKRSSFSRRIYSVKHCSTVWDCHNPQCQLEHKLRAKMNDSCKWNMSYRCIIWEFPTAQGRNSSRKLKAAWEMPASIWAVKARKIYS